MRTPLLPIMFVLMLASTQPTLATVTGTPDVESAYAVESGNARLDSVWSPAQKSLSLIGIHDQAGFFTLALDFSAEGVATATLSHASSTAAIHFDLSDADAAPTGDTLGFQTILAGITATPLGEVLTLDAISSNDDGIQTLIDISEVIDGSPQPHSRLGRLAGRGIVGIGLAYLAADTIFPWAG